MTIARLLRLILPFVPLVTHALAQSQLSAQSSPLPQSPQSSVERYEGKRIESIELPIWAKDVDLPIKVGGVLRLKDVTASEDILRDELASIQSGFAVPTRLDVTLIVPNVMPFPGGGGGVDVFIVPRRLVLTEDDTPGRAMDQASTWTPADVGGAHQFEIDFNRDQRLGDAIGGLASVGPFLFPSGVSLASSASGWTSASDGYYDATGQVQVRPGASSDLAALNCGPEFDVSYLPFGANTIRNISVTGGCGYRFRSSSLEQWRLEARYRFARQKLDTLNVPERAYDDHGFESAILREFSMESGFVRLEPWIDGAHSDILGFNARGGALVRTYREWNIGTRTSCLLDLRAGVGVSVGPLPANRSFTGGAEIHPDTLEEPLDKEEFVWMGPVLRGYGVSSFYPPAGTSPLTRGGSSYSNISATVGLPGFAQSLFSTRDPDLNPQLQELSKNLTAVARAKAVDDYLERGFEPKEARRLAQKRLDDMRKTIRNIITNTKEFSLHPLAAFDYGEISSRQGNSVHDWSVGGGVRSWIRGGIVEVMYMQNGGAFPGANTSNIIVRYTVRSSIGALNESRFVTRKRLEPGLFGSRTAATRDGARNPKPGDGRDVPRTIGQQ